MGSGSGSEFGDPFGSDFGDLLTDGANNEQRTRALCEGCKKMQILCICSRFKGMVENKTRITILQHPSEKDHAVGSARVALLGLRNVSLITVPELDPLASYRRRPKVPGSRRSLIGRDGRKLQFMDRVSNFVDYLTATESCRVGNVNDAERISLDAMLHRLKAREMEGLSVESLYIDHQRLCPSLLMEIEAPPDVALLYPSDRAIDLIPALNCITHLILLDGTWAKAKRMYHENPWLQSLPHFRLPVTSPSLYQGIRRQPKLGCLSTLESIVYALQVLEPETQGLHGLLAVFDSMVEDHRKCRLHSLSATQENHGEEKHL